ncbi:MAG: helicase-related protein, partial [Trebonia sp.]
LDLRLLGRDTGEPTKIATAAKRIADIHHRHAGRRFDGLPAKGVLQLVFCDLGTPGPAWNAYTELRHQLTIHGVPDAAIRYVHDAKNDREKAQLFAACRTGDVAVLIGSTEKMGVGTNVQDRMKALHHLDCPWRPADLAQRDGRGVRQGNLNNEIELHRYVVEGSFDAYLWQTVERKARFIAQVMRGKLDVREIEDVGDTALSYSEVKALATGDPLILDQARADAELTRLARLERSHSRNHQLLAGTLTSAETSITELSSAVARLDARIPRHRDTRGDKFAITIAGRRLASRADAATALRDHLAEMLTAIKAASKNPTTVGEIGGYTILATAHTFPGPQLRLHLDDLPRTAMTITAEDLADTKPLGLITRLEHRAASLPATRADLGAELAHARSERDRAADALAAPFPHAGALEAARRKSAALA